MDYLNHLIRGLYCMRCLGLRELGVKSVIIRKAISLRSLRALGKRKLTQQTPTHTHYHAKACVCLNALNHHDQHHCFGFFNLYVLRGVQILSGLCCFDRGFHFGNSACGLSGLVHVFGLDWRYNFIIRMLSTESICVLPILTFVKWGRGVEWPTQKSMYFVKLGNRFAMKLILLYGYIYTSRKPGIVIFNKWFWFNI